MYLDIRKKKFWKKIIFDEVALFFVKKWFLAKKRWKNCLKITKKASNYSNDLQMGFSFVFHVWLQEKILVDTYKVYISVQI